MRIILRLLSTGCVGLAIAGPFAVAAPAAAQVLALEDIVEVRLLEGWRQRDGRHMSGIEIRLAPGWKTYWRAPGEGGIPPRLVLDSPVPTEMHWPRPEVFFTNGMRSIGYQGDVIFPLELDLEGGDQTVSGHIEIGVCEDVCMPVSLDLDALLPGSGRPDPRIIAAMSDGVQMGGDVGAGDVTCQITPISDGLRLEARMEVPNVGNDETVVFELPDQSVWISEAQSSRLGTEVVAVAEMVPTHAGPFALDRSELRVTVIGSQMAVELYGCESG